MVLCTVAILVFALLTFLRALCNYARLKTVPGPLVTGLSDLWGTYARNSRDYGRRLACLHEKYGKVVRLGPHSVSVSDPTVIFPVHNGRPSEKSVLEDCGYSELGLLSNETRSVDAESSSYDAARQVHWETIMHYEGFIDQAANNLVATMRRHRLLHLTAFVQSFAADFVHHLALEESALQGMPSNAEIPSYHWYNCVCKCLTLPIMEYSLLRSPTARLKRSRGISLGRKGVNQGINDKQGQSIMYGYSAGSDVSLTRSCHSIPSELEYIAMSFVSTFVFLLSFDAVMARLRNEIDTAFNKGLLSDPPRWRELAKLRYLDAVFKESMRRLPHLTNDLEVIASPEGAMVAGYYIPPETLIECHSEALRSDPGVYGNDVHVYRPARWLIADVQRRKLMTHNLLPSTGSNNRPEVRVALLELKKVIAIILMKFNLQRVHADEDLTPDTEGFGSITVSCTPRTY